MVKATWRSAWMTGLMLALLAGAARNVQAQTIGIGARMVSVSGADSLALDSSDSSNTHFAGGYLRLHATKRLALEASMDYQSTTNTAETARIRNTPIQASALLYLTRTALAPYFLAGVGWYKHHVEALDNGKPVLTTDTTNFGYHTGLGGEVMFGKHAAVYVDYRYTWVDANGVGGLSGALRSAASLTTVMGMLNALDGNSDSNSSISRSGSMWTGGLTIYF